MSVISREVAEKEVKAWLDHKKVPQRKRDQKDTQANIEKMIAGFQDGVLTLNPETFEITQTLLFPVGVDIKDEKFVYKSRIPYARVQSELKGIATDDIGKFTPAYIAAITGQAKAIIAAMDTEDMAIATAIASFFQ
jgi:hypothetical protein